MKKTLYSFFAVLAALVLVSCGQSTPSTTESSASSSQVAKEKQITITVSIAPEGKEAHSKTLKVAEKANLMEVLKANYKIEEKSGLITSIDGVAQDESKGLYWMYKINGEMAPKGQQKQLSKMEIPSNFIKKFINKKKSAWLE